MKATIVIPTIREKSIKGEYWDKLTKAMDLWVTYVHKGFTKRK